MRAACSLRGWREHQEIDAEIQRLAAVCDGVDNVDGINRHYEKMKWELYRAKMQQS
jgi:hypothetical protein